MKIDGGPFFDGKPFHLAGLPGRARQHQIGCVPTTGDHDVFVAVAIEVSEERKSYVCGTKRLVGKASSLKLAVAVENIDVIEVCRSTMGKRGQKVLKIYKKL